MGLNDYESSAAAKETHQRISEKIIAVFVNPTGWVNLPICVGGSYWFTNFHTFGGQSKLDSFAWHNINSECLFLSNQSDFGARVIFQRRV